MTPEEREAFYDAEIAPVLHRIAEKCRDNGLSFLALVEWEPGQVGRTFYTVPEVGMGIRVASVASRVDGNADMMIMNLMEYGRKHGHSSICLKQLGVPFEGGVENDDAGDREHKDR